LLNSPIPRVINLVAALLAASAVLYVSFVGGKGLPALGQKDKDEKSGWCGKEKEASIKVGEKSKKDRKMERRR